MKKVFITITILILLPAIQFAQGTVIPYPDNSPSSSDFILMGVSSPEKIWGADDYNYVVQLFDQIYEVDKFSLPRKNSDYSGSIFERMTTKENFAFLVDENANLGNQIIAFEEIKGLGFRLLIYYIEDTEPEERFGTEVIECLYLDAWLNARGMTLYDKLLDQLQPEQASSNNFKRGYEQLSRSYKRSLEELFYIFEVDYQRFDLEVLSKFAPIFVQLITNLPEKKSTASFHYRLEALSKSFPNKDIRKLLKKALL